MSKSRRVYCTVGNTGKIEYAKILEYLGKSFSVQAIFKVIRSTVCPNILFGLCAQVVRFVRTTCAICAHNLCDLCARLIRSASCFNSYEYQFSTYFEWDGIFQRTLRTQYLDLQQLIRINELHKTPNQNTHSFQIDMGLHITLLDFRFEVQKMPISAFFRLKVRFMAHSRIPSRLLNVTKHTIPLNKSWDPSQPSFNGY